MDKEQRKDELVKEICIAYYLNNKTQQEIAQQFYISRSKVSRILTYAKEHNYITTKLNFKVEKQYHFKSELQERYGLERMEAVDIGILDENFDLEFNKRAAQVIDSFMRHNISIGCSWGSYINDIIEYLPERNLDNTKVIQLFGEITNDAESLDQSTVIKKFAQKYNAGFYQLSAPLHVANSSVKRSLEKMSIISETLKLLDNSELILTSVGTFNSYGKHNIWEKFQDDHQFQEAINLGGIGYFCSYIIDVHGQIIDCEYNDCNIAISKDKIGNKKIILLVSEMYKYNVIKALLENNMVDVLITTLEIAERLNADK
ncbi:sugar-binding domain-containing protein [Mollicutes bacterium LVI A0039]|nr:sugar-binding domain-containing protein [Mollicutes bacterium LVI A0039]